MQATIDYRRLNISELSKATNTCRKLLHEWVNKGYLRPSQLVGSRYKYTIDSFQEAEKQAFNDNQKVMEEAKKSMRKDEPKHFGGKISDEWIDNIDELISQMDKKTLAEKSGKKLSKRNHKNFSQK